jgi:acyl-CoA thioesterase-2
VTEVEIRSAWPDHPDYSIDLVPCRGTARVRVGDSVLAESTSALRLIETDHVERLYFPESDVRLDLLEANDHHTVCPFKGRASYWSFADRHSPVEDLFWAYPRPMPEVAGISGYLGVYHEKSAVEVETPWPDRTASSNRFPLWGDQEDLMVLLDCEPGDQPGRFVAPGYHQQTRNVVEGGQLLGQAIVAASRTVPDQRVTWASTTFVRAANFDDPIELTVDELRRGRTFSTLSIRSEQVGRLVAPAMVLLDRGAPDAMRATDEMPQVPGPYDSEPYDMGVAGRDLRVVDGAYDPDPDRIGPPEIHAWMRYRDNPSEVALRQALVSQGTTHWAIAAAMRPHPGFGEALAHVSLSTGPVAMTLAFHDDAPVDEWLLYSTTGIWSGRGLIQGDGRVYTQHGVLVASYTLQAMVRALMASAGGKDASTAM